VPKSNEKKSTPEVKNGSRKSGGIMTRPTILARSIALLCALTCSVWPVSAQQTATEYNDKDKQKLAQIAQRPEVIHRIQDTWDARRRQDMEFAFNVNQFF